MNYQHKYLKYKSKYLEKKYGYRVNFKIDNNNNDLDYKQKYLKYKSKYLDIKYGGAGATVAKPQAHAPAPKPLPHTPAHTPAPKPLPHTPSPPIVAHTQVPVPKTGALPAHTPTPAQVQAPKTGAPPAHTPGPAPAPAQVPASKTGAPPAAITVHISAGPGPGPGPATPAAAPAEKPKKSILKSIGKAILNFIVGKKGKLTDKNINDKLKLIFASLLTLSNEEISEGQREQLKQLNEEILTMTNIELCGSLANNNKNENLKKMISITINSEIDKIDKKPVRNSNMLTILETSLKNAVEPFRFINEASKEALKPCLQKAINIVLPQYDKDYYDKHYMPK